METRIVLDVEMLIKISEVFETLVSTLIGKSIFESNVNDLKAISEKLEVIKLKLTQIKKRKRKKR